MSALGRNLTLGKDEQEYRVDRNSHNYSINDAIKDKHYDNKTR